MNKLKLAIIGQGRSGRNIHGAFLKNDNNVYFDVVAVVDADAQRRERALQEYPGCEVYADYKELFNRTDLDLVVNSTFSNMHYSITKDLLQHKFNVVVEKPFARTSYECNDLIATAKANNVMLTVFHQSLLSPYHVEPKKFIESGKLGEIQQISMRFNGLSRRWDWQTLQYRLGGGVYNTGPHPFGFAASFLGFDPEAKVVFSKLSSNLVSGDADDYAKAIITAPGKPVIDIEVSALDAFCDYNVKVQGSKGTYQCTSEGYKVKYIPDGANPEKPVVSGFLADAEGMPIYCREQLVTVEEEGKYSGDAFDLGTKRFYESVYNHLTTGAPLAVRPEYAAQAIGFIETMHAQNPMPVKFVDADK